MNDVTLPESSVKDIALAIGIKHRREMAESLRTIADLLDDEMRFPMPGCVVISIFKPFGEAEELKQCVADFCRFQPGSSVTQSICPHTGNLALRSEISGNVHLTLECDGEPLGLSERREKYTPIKELDLDQLVTQAQACEDNTVPGSSLGSAAKVLPTP